MANVWFVQRVGGDWKKVGDQPAYRQQLRDLIFKLDLGPQRRLSPESVPEPGDASLGVTASTKVFVEVTEDDLRDSYFGGYFPGWYDSPYRAPEVERRLHTKSAPAAHHG